MCAFYKIDKQQPGGLHDSQDPILYASFSSLSASDEGPLAPYMACPLSRVIFVELYTLNILYTTHTVSVELLESHLSFIRSTNSSKQVGTYGICVVYEQDV